MKSINLSSLYDLRNEFTIIAVTGRSGSGCSTVAKKLSKGYDKKEEFPDPSSFDLSNNSFKKYRIIHNYAEVNFKPFQLIQYKDVIVLFILKNGYQNFVNFLTGLNQEVLKYGFYNFDKEINELKTLQSEFETISNKFIAIEKLRDQGNEEFKPKLYELYFESDFKLFTQKFFKSISIESLIKRNKIFQIIANNLRSNGSPFHSKPSHPNCLFTVVELINDIIKAHKNHKDEVATQIVIDSLRNPFEILFFKQRFAAFYLFAVNRKNEERIQKLEEKYRTEYKKIELLLADEYKGGKGNEFYRQYVRDCIEKADIHITFRSIEEANRLNEKRLNGDNTSPYFSWEMQILKYVSLISHPGLVTPSPEERCMQMAYTAKYNSGCISRQVGASITDSYYSLKAIGWNNTPEGQVPCVLRNAEVLLNASAEELKEEDKNQSIELQAFTPYEKTDEKFQETFKQNYEHQLLDNKDKLKGRNISFCFKTLQNSCYEGKNQVHTRSLHAEESAFLQITKYGGEGIKNGKLFTTASPCELCSKKAYQLGISVIYYIDPYPGISERQILNTGKNRPEVRLFNGAIGSAYHWIYEPLMAYKDELSLLLGQNIKDLTTQLKDDLDNKDQTIELQKKTIQKLEERIKKLE